MSCHVTWHAPSQILSLQTNPLLFLFIFMAIIGLSQSLVKSGYLSLISTDLMNVPSWSPPFDLVVK